jgi:hypothetical protein
MLSLLGTQDPRLNQTGEVDFRLTRLLKGMKATDAEAQRVKPIPLKVLHQVLASASTSHTAGATAVADMACIAFFFLLRPGEYTYNQGSTTAFRCCDVRLYQDDNQIPWHTATTADLDRANYTTYTFVTQKNGVRGEVVGQGRTGHPLCCPVWATIRRLQHHILWGSAPTQPLATYHDGHKLQGVLPRDITEVLRVAAALIGPSLGFRADEISARSLRAGGAMALLCADVDTDVIRLLGRWKSDQMFRYLFVQARPLVNRYAQRMLDEGDFNIFPGPPGPPP